MDKLKKAGWVTIAGLFVVGGLLTVAKTLGCEPCGEVLNPILGALSAKATPAE